MFTQCSWLVQFLAVLLFMQSFAAMAIFLSSFVTRGRYIIGTSMVLLMAVGFSMMCMKGAELFEPEMVAYGGDTNTLIWCFLSIQPWFHYMRVQMAIIATVYPLTGGRAGDPTRLVMSEVESTWFGYSDLDHFRDYNTVDYRGNTQKSVEYTTGTSLWAQVFLSVFYYCMAWYCGQVASSDEGSHESCCFCWSPRYWGVARTPVLVMNDDDTIGLEKSRSQLDQSVRCYKLSKAYKEEMAVLELTMTIESSCCLALLGTNGAGKSTLMKTLTGVHKPTHGNAFIFGLDVSEDIAHLQEIMGVCPQEDLLWPELTAREHLHIYSRFKGILEDEIEQHCLDILTAIGLLLEADNRVATYSGGMKRRLSVGVASVASPRILLLDEPSTGMDPLSKRRVWAMIEQIKKDRVVLLTTHSMEEADALGDKVAILDKGRL